jgi:predicted phosphoadenosine phosphosulfate sulfurtransferase
MQKRINSYIKVWKGRCYSDDIPDEAPVNLEKMGKVPSYRLICLAILKNDHGLESLGFTPKKSNWYNVLKRIELKNRGKL